MNVRPESKTLPEGNQQSLPWLRPWRSSFGSDPKGESSETDRCTYLELHSFRAAEETSKMDRRPRNGGNACKSHPVRGADPKHTSSYTLTAKKPSGLKTGRSEREVPVGDARRARRRVERRSASPLSGTCHQNHDEMPPRTGQPGRRREGRREQELARTRTEPRALALQERPWARPRWAARSFHSEFKLDLPRVCLSQENKGTDSKSSLRPACPPKDRVQRPARGRSLSVC